MYESIVVARHPMMVEMTAGIMIYYVCAKTGIVMYLSYILPDHRSLKGFITKVLEVSTFMIISFNSPTTPLERKQSAFLGDIEDTFYE